MNDTVVQSAMQIILHAGDARCACKQALDAIAAGNFDEAQAKMKESQKHITEAHKVQTDAIQDEMRRATGELEGDSEYSLLFTHAQDTLMTVYSEINIAKQMIKIFTAYELRIAALEKRD